MFIYLLVEIVFCHLSQTSVLITEVNSFNP